MRLPSRIPARSQLFQSCVFDNWTAVFPGLPKRNPGLELANAFSVVHSCKGLHFFAAWLRGTLSRPHSKEQNIRE